MTFLDMSRRQTRNFVMAALMFCLSAATLTSTTGAAEAAPRDNRPGQVYLLRGLLNVFSLGMDELGAKLKAAGVNATVHGYLGWSGLTDTMISRYRGGDHSPIILMGHSNGADTTILIARKLQQANVPVALIVNFDPVSPDPVPANVREVVNFYVPAGWGRAVQGDPKFRGQLANVNQNATSNHFNVEKSDELHRKTVAKVLQVLKRQQRRPAPKKPAANQMSAAPAAAAAPAN